MKNYSITMVCILLLVQAGLFAQTTDVYEIGLASGGGDNIAVRMRCIDPTNPCPTTSDAILDITFGIKWLSSYNINLGAPTGGYNVSKSGVEKQQGAYEYQIYQLNVAPLFFPEDWSTDVWYTIATISAAPIGTGTYKFEINETGFNPSSDPNFNVNGDDYLPAINGFVELGSPLPIELLNLHAYPEGDDVAIEWTTATETGSSHFDVERSNDGRNFRHLTRVAAAGFSTEERSYRTIDENPSPGTNYYRLKQVDFDGQFEYSKTISIEIPNERPHLTITPNPNPGQFTLSIQNPEKAPITARLTDSWGRVVWVFSEETELPEVQIRVEPEVPLPGGIYSLVIFVGRHQLTERVAIQRP